ncbi:MAG: disulfide bond formation protein B, partial [Lysinibacillus fusiformis]|nr:disulfide bond formation protein B [Lysinibacillus fusiformis]
MSKKEENGLLFIWIVSAVATLGSLYFSEIRHYEPCKLCWIQRIFM